MFSLTSSLLFALSFEWRSHLSIYQKHIRVSVPGNTLIPIFFLFGSRAFGVGTGIIVQEKYRRRLVAGEKMNGEGPGGCFWFSGSNFGGLGAFAVRNKDTVISGAQVLT